MTANNLDPSGDDLSLKIAINLAGGPSAVAKETKVSTRAVHKWLQKNSLPRTDYTGETAYSASIVALVTEKHGHRFTASQLLDSLRESTAA